MTATLPTWELALANRPSVDATQIEASALHFEINTGRGRHIVLSLKREHFLPVATMEQIQSFFLTANWSSPQTAIDDYRKLCINHVLTGGPIQPAAPQLIGRAVEQKALVQGIFLANRRKIPRRQIDALVARLIARSTTRADLTVLAGLRMSRFAVWVTWDAPSGGIADPFAFSSPPCADHIRASLGLSMDGVGQPIILLTYESGSVPEIMRPTCADAGLFLRFEPPPLGFEAHGLTKPWEEIPGLTHRKTQNAQTANPRPEGLHPPTLFPAGLVVRRRGSILRPKL